MTREEALAKAVLALEADDKERRGKTINQQMESGDYYIRDFEGPMTARRILILLDAIGRVSPERIDALRRVAATG